MLIRSKFDGYSKDGVRRLYKGGGTDNSAREMEAERQARVQAATDTINAIFNNQVQNTGTQTVRSSGGSLLQALRDPYTAQSYTYFTNGDPANSRDQLYANQRTAVYDLNSQDVNRQAAEAERQNRFGLARSGLLGGSVDVDTNADIQRRTNEGLLRAGSIADQAAADLKVADEQARSNLISLAQSGIDTGTAAQMALGQLKGNAENAAGARAGATVGGLFNDMSQAYLYNQQQQGRAAGTGNQGSQWYGVSSPSTKYAGS